MGFSEVRPPDGTPEWFLAEWNRLVRENKKLQEEIERLERKVNFDSVTGLRVYQSTEEFARECISAMKLVDEKRDSSSKHARHFRRRGKSVHCIGFVDMDSLSGINNDPDFGYDIGTRVLVALANILNRWRRSDDLVTRLFGRKADEFCLLFTSANEREAMRLLCEDRRRFEAVIAKRFSGLVGRVSFSFGVCPIHSSYTESQIIDAIVLASKTMHRHKIARKDIDRRSATPSD